MTASINGTKGTNGTPTPIPTSANYKIPECAGKNFPQISYVYIYIHTHVLLLLYIYIYKYIYRHICYIYMLYICYIYMLYIYTYYTLFFGGNAVGPLPIFLVSVSRPPARPMRRPLVSSPWYPDH